MIKQTTFILTIILISNASAVGQINLKKNDSLKIKSICEDFYNWYTYLIKSKKINDFNPNFIKSADGMTNLDFTNYRQGLSKYFTDGLIERRINNFKDCQNNLQTITYDHFQNFTDLDDFENIKCDFANCYEFIGGQEPIDGVLVTNIKLIENSEAEATVIFYVLADGDNLSFGERLLKLVKKKKEWIINDI